MQEISYVRDTQFSKDTYFSLIMKDIGRVLVTFDRISNHHVSGPLIVEVNQFNIAEINNLLKSRVEKVVLAFLDKSAFKQLDFLKHNLDKIYGFIDLSLDYEYNVPLMRNYINQNYEKTIVDLEKLSIDLEKILDFTKTELGNVKALHDRFVKIRTEDLRGGKFSIKFMAGEKSGGEFFDFLEFENEIIVFEAGTDSYITSSMIIAELENFKGKKDGNIDAIKSLIKSISHHANEMNSKFNYLVSILNLKKLELTYFKNGNSKVFISNELKSLSVEGILKLKRGEKIFLISEGLINNWKIYNEEKAIEDFLIMHSNLNTKDFMNELFFEIARHKNSSFLTYDALMYSLEINPNIIHEA